MNMLACTLDDAHGRYGEGRPEEFGRKSVVGILGDDRLLCQIHDLKSIIGR